MKLATTTNDFVKYFPYIEDTDKMLPLLKNSGFKYIDLSFYGMLHKENSIYDGNWEKWAYEIGNLAAKLGVEFVQAHSTDSAYLQGLERDKKNQMIFRQLDICNKLGIKNTVVHAVCTSGGSREDFMNVNQGVYNELLKYAEKYDINILTENTCKKNNASYHLVNAEDYFELKAKVQNHPLFGYCWDVGHAHMEGVNQYDEIMSLGKDLKAVHIHDNDKSGDTHIMPYLGTISMDEIMNGLLDSKYDGIFTMESTTSLRPASYWQGDRNVYAMDKRVAMPPMELALKMEEALYVCGKYILGAYYCFEE